MNKVRLGDVTSKIGSGATPRGGKNAYKGGSVTLIRSLNVYDSGFKSPGLVKINDEQARQLKNVNVEKDDVLFNITGASVARCCVVPPTVLPARVNQHVSIIRVNKTKLDPYYLHNYLILESVKNYLLSASGGSSREAITKNQLEDLMINAPDLKEQQQIAAVLLSLDDKIELNHKINAELEQMARKLYDYWFVQFDFPDSEGKPYKSSGCAMKFSPELNREIPEGCEVQNMYANDLFDVIKPKIDKFVGTKQYIATADVNGLSITDGSPITYDGRESRANMQPKAYTVWFAKMKESIKHVLVGDYSEDLLNEAIFSTGFMGMQTDKEAFEYLSLTVHRPYFELVKDANSNGATMAAIGNNDMKNIKLLVPDERILAQFHEIARPILEKMDCNRQESQKLAHLRDWLLPMLMNDQVTVK